jgi:N-acetylmuramic acid 6-phosphate (MurNAc-6-P) etherase
VNGSGFAFGSVHAHDTVPRESLIGAPPDWVIGIIAGGDRAIRQPIENAEDSKTQAWSDLSVWQIDTQ